MSAQIEAYQKAITELEAAANKVQRLVSTIRDGSSKLGDWKRLCVSNAPPGVGFPPELALSPHTPSIDARAWPTGEQIAQAVSGWHQARGAVRQAYEAIPASQREVVTPPPG